MFVKIAPSLLIPLSSALFPFHTLPPFPFPFSIVVGVLYAAGFAAAMRCLQVYSNVAEAPVQHVCLPTVNLYGRAGLNSAEHGDLAVLRTATELRISVIQGGSKEVSCCTVTITVTKN